MLGTDEIVKQAMEEEKQRKQAKAQAKGDAPRKHKGKTLAEIEEEEGGPVKQSMAPMAHVKRAKKRKDRNDIDDDTDLPVDVEAAEEAAAVDEEDGIKFTAFNLKEERATGYFDEDGGFVERKEEDAEDKDAWLEADGGAVVSEAVRRKIQARQKEHEAEDSARPLSGRQLADLKASIVALMQPQETVPMLLKRLGGARGSKADMETTGPPKATKNIKLQKTATRSQQESDVGARKAIETVTDAASKLMLQGETDIYDLSKEELEQSIALYAPVDTGGGADGGDDMFASDDEGLAKPCTQRDQGVDMAHVPPPVMPTATMSGDVEYGNWPVKELRRFCQERGVDVVGAVEKDELVSKVKEVAAADAQAQAVPLGYVFDAASGYYANTDTRLYYHPGTGTFFNGSTWYRWDGFRYLPAS